MGYREEMAELVNKALKSSTRCALIKMPVRMGRSGIIAHICKEHILQGGRVLIVTPRVDTAIGMTDTINRICGNEAQVGWCHSGHECQMTDNIVVATCASAFVEAKQHAIKFRVAPTMLILNEVSVYQICARDLINVFASHKESKVIAFNVADGRTCEEAEFWSGMNPFMIEVSTDAVTLPKSYYDIDVMELA